MVGCQRCGASLEVPLDLAATTVRCSYCGHTTSLPADVMNARRQERMARMAATTPEVTPPPPPPSNVWMVWVASAVGMTIAFGVVVPILTRTTTTDPPTTTTTTTTTPAPVAIPKPIASDAKSTGQTRTTELMKQLYDKGCKNVVMPPERAQGDTKLDTKLVAGTCVRVLVVTGSAENKLTLAMKNPFGEELKTPAASSEVDFMYCPKQSGPHPTHITATTEDFYTVAAVECPKSLAGK